MSHFDLRLLKAIPDLPSTIFFYTLAAFDYFFSYFDLIIYPPAILPSSQIWKKKHAKKDSFDWREVDDGVKATLRFLSKVDFFPFFRSWLESSKEEFDPHGEDLNITDSSWWINLLVLTGGGGRCQ